MPEKDEQQLDVFSYLSPEQRVPQERPPRSLRVIRRGSKSHCPWFRSLLMTCLKTT
jgi:hypothetical protein